MILADTNVLAHLLMDAEQQVPASALRRKDRDWHTESLAFHELTNVMTTAVRAGVLDVAGAQQLLRNARALKPLQVHAVADVDTLAAAAEFGISGHDARFIMLARALGVKLTTEDRRLRAAVPAYTQSVAEALSV